MGANGHAAESSAPRTSTCTQVANATISTSASHSLTVSTSPFPSAMIALPHADLSNLFNVIYQQGNMLSSAMSALQSIHQETKQREQELKEEVDRLRKKQKTKGKRRIAVTSSSHASSSVSAAGSVVRIAEVNRGVAAPTANQMTATSTTFTLPPVQQLTQLQDSPASNKSSPTLTNNNTHHAQQHTSPIVPHDDNVIDTVDTAAVTSPSASSGIGSDIIEPSVPNRRFQESNENTPNNNQPDNANNIPPTLRLDHVHPLAPSPSPVAASIASHTSSAAAASGSTQNENSRSGDVRQKSASAPSEDSMELHNNAGSPNSSSSSVHSEQVASSSNGCLHPLSPIREIHCAEAVVVAPRPASAVEIPKDSTIQQPQINVTVAPVNDVTAQSASASSGAPNSAPSSAALNSTATVDQAKATSQTAASALSNQASTAAVVAPVAVAVAIPVPTSATTSTVHPNLASATASSSTYVATSSTTPGQVDLSQFFPPSFFRPTLQPTSTHRTGEFASFSCHQCRNNQDPSLLWPCQNPVPVPSRRRGGLGYCRKSICHRCLFRNFPQLRSMKPFICPSCVGLCKCRSCVSRGIATVSAAIVPTNAAEYATCAAILSSQTAAVPAAQAISTAAAAASSAIVVDFSMNNSSAAAAATATPLPTAGSSSASTSSCDLPPLPTPANYTPTNANAAMITQATSASAASAASASESASRSAHKRRRADNKSSTKVKVAKRSDDEAHASNVPTSSATNSSTMHPPFHRIPSDQTGSGLFRSSSLSFPPYAALHTPSNTSPIIQRDSPQLSVSPHFAPASIGRFLHSCSPAGNLHLNDDAAADDSTSLSSEDAADENQWMNEEHNADALLSNSWSDSLFQLSNGSLPEFHDQHNASQEEKNGK